MTISKMQNPFKASYANPLASTNEGIQKKLEESGATEHLKSMHEKFEKFEEKHEWASVFAEAGPDVKGLKAFFVEPPKEPEKKGLGRISQIASEDARYIEAYKFLKKGLGLLKDEKQNEILEEIGEQLLGRLVDGIFRNDFPLPLAMITPAATIGSLFLGLPHTHPHPPSLIPPAPPVPIPAVGAVMTGNPTVLIGGLPAACCGDIGFAVGCCSLSPFFKIYTGSSKVKIGGKRAARMFDIVKFCQPTPPTPPGAKPPKPPPANFDEAITEVGKAKLKSLYTDAEEGDSKLKTAWKTFSTLKENRKKVQEKVTENKKKLHEWQEAQEKAEKAEDAAARDPGNEQAALAAEAAKDAAQAATADALADAEAMAATLASFGMDNIRAALDKLLGKDPGTPPPSGLIMMGHPTVWIAGFPMPESSVFAGGLGKLREKAWEKSKRKKWAANRAFKKYRKEWYKKTYGFVPKNQQMDSQAALKQMKLDAKNAPKLAAIKKQMEADAKNKGIIATAKFKANSALGRGRQPTPREAREALRKQHVEDSQNRWETKKEEEKRQIAIKRGSEAETLEQKSADEKAASDVADKSMSRQDTYIQQSHMNNEARDKAAEAAKSKEAWRAAPNDLSKAQDAADKANQADTAAQKAKETSEKMQALRDASPQNAASNASDAANSANEAASKVEPG